MIISDSALTLKIHFLAGNFIWLDWIIVFFGGYFEYLLLAFLLGLLLLSKNSRIQYWRMIAVGLIAALFSRFAVAETIRALYPRARPFEIFEFQPLILHETTSGFPSGHASFYFALATIIFLYDRKLGGWFFVGATLISFARVAAGIHFLGDILLGFSVGVLSAVFIYKLACKRFPNLAK
ncbi:phosphatase PAP2 family protein [Candidatus Parcubacteria bacterium]|nr:MAG: phosphatase PAP2 family protein [Candidatus Parcubacteria bacterium]